MIIIKNRLFIIYIFFTLEFVLSSQCFSSFENVGTNARFQAMGGAGVANICTSDAMFYNCSGIALSNGIQIALSYCNPFGIKELNHGTFSVSFPAGFGNFGFASKTFGNELYSENEYFLSYANSVRGKFSYGASVRYSRLEISKYGHDTAIAVDVGFTTSISPVVKWGFTATNINRAKIGARNDELPRIFISGFNVKPVNNLYLNFDVYKDTQFPTELHFGMEYSLFDRFVLRSGFVTEIASFTAGMGLKFSHFDLDYAFQSHNDLGFTHNFSLSFSFKKQSVKESDNIDLMRTYDRININKATKEELQKIKGIGPAIAERIVEYREEIGNFENIEDIKNVKGIGEKIFQNMRQYLSVD